IQSAITSTPISRAIRSHGRSRSHNWWFLTMKPTGEPPKECLTFLCLVESRTASEAFYYGRSNRPCYPTPLSSSATETCRDMQDMWCRHAATIPHYCAKEVRRRVLPMQFLRLSPDRRATLAAGSVLH